MIDCVSINTAHLFGDAMASQYRLRYRIFVERRKWQLPTWRGMEFDEFDTPATSYFIWRDDGGQARGIARIAPTTLPYMIERHWPDMVTREPLPSDPAVWEGSRIGIDQTIDPAQRRRVLAEIFCAYLEFGLAEGIDRFLVLMPVAFLKRTVAKVGWPPRLLGPVRRIEASSVVVASMKVSTRILENVRENMGIEGPILRTAQDIQHQNAA